MHCAPDAERDAESECGKHRREPGANEAAVEFNLAGDVSYSRCQSFSKRERGRVLHRFAMFGQHSALTACLGPMWSASNR